MIPSTGDPLNEGVKVGAKGAASPGVLAAGVRRAGIGETRADDVDIGATH